jgi:tetratricopeptide (TPR) repeat protein
MHSGSSAGHIGGSNLGGMHHGNLGGASGLNGSRGITHSAPSHINQSVLSNSGGHHGTNGNLNSAMGGSRGVGSATHAGNHLTSLSHSAGAAGQGAHQSQFLSNHGAHNSGFRGTNNLHNGNVHNGNLANHLHNGNHNGNWNHNNWNHNNWNRNNGFFSPFFFGGFWPWWGGFGYNNWWYGRNWGWPYWYGYGYPFFGYPFLGMYGLYGGYGYGGGGYGYGYGSGYPYYAYNAYGTDELADAGQQAAPDQAAQGQIGEFAAAGETDFKAGSYDNAVRDWRHALLDDPSNGTLVLMFAQALFATGKFDEAAGAVQQGLAMLPQDQWGVVVKNYTELYPKVGEYTKQLRVLEKAVKDQPDSPALRFLVGYHYGYLGYPQDAMKQLEKAKALAPQDVLTSKLLGQFSGNGNDADKPDGNAEAELPPQAKADLPKF